MIRNIARVIYLLGLVSMTYMEGSIRVCTTTSMIQDAVENVGGEKVEVYCLMGPGVDPHLYKVTPRDIMHIKNSDVIFYNGLHLEGRMTDVLSSLTKQKKNVFAVADGAECTKLIYLNENKSLVDPHIWFDPLLWIDCVEYITQRLSEIDPPNSDIYRLNSELYISKLQAMHAWNLLKIAQLPKPSRFLITSHDAYNYLGNRYDIQVVGVQGISTASEAGLADIVSSVDFIKQHKIKAIFVETSVSPQAIKRISQDSGAKIGGEIFSDSLGVKGEKCKIDSDLEVDLGTYIGMFKYNINTIVGALK